MADASSILFAGFLGVASGFRLNPRGPINVAIINEGAQRDFAGRPHWIGAR